MVINFLFFPPLSFGALFDVTLVDFFKPSSLNSDYPLQFSVSFALSSVLLYVHRDYLRTITSIRDQEPSTSTLTFTQLPSSGQLLSDNFYTLGSLSGCTATTDPERTVDKINATA